MVDVTPAAFFHQTHHHHPNLTGNGNDELPPPFPFLPPSPSFASPHLAGDDDNSNDTSARYVSTSFLSAPSIATIATTAAGSSLSSSSPMSLLPTSSAPASSSPRRAPPATVTAALKGLPERRLVLPPLGGMLLHLLPGVLRCSLATHNFHELFHALLLFLNLPCQLRHGLAMRRIPCPHCSEDGVHMLSHTPSSPAARALYAATTGTAASRRSVSCTGKRWWKRKERGRGAEAVVGGCGGDGDGARGG
ncbi:Os04g0294625 [Oryza sativa Japonica Group]|uniref:Os04g0294625 protein n=1 Tax=Oryza sativa subsp. japonica TaxID=39947 RepID=A0A0P0W893_ORYSJ|nr:Os04g0294625 [Oryza sativa Japonica Group]